MKGVAMLLALSMIGILGASTASAGPATVTIATRHTAALGTFLESSGRTLYLFEADARNQSTCSGPCAGTWPPLTTIGRPLAGPGAKARLLGTIKRGEARQVTYNGHALYFYSGDTKPGETGSQNLKLFGAKWFVVNAAGAAITAP
jgi:predicted lipoprotein with Yx(FWY)xxD motif